MKERLTTPESMACLHCGGDYLHQGTVEVFWREQEDSATGLCARITESTVELHTNADTNNPSRRRQGLRIRLKCENCPGVCWLTVSQHKGCTYVAVVKATDLEEREVCVEF